MKSIICKEVTGSSWRSKIDNFVAQMEVQFPMDDKGLIDQLAENIMVKDLILSEVCGMGSEKQFEIYKLVLEAVKEDEDAKAKH